MLKLFVPAALAAVRLSVSFRPPETSRRPSTPFSCVAEVTDQNVSWPSRVVMASCLESGRKATQRTSACS